MDFNPLGNFDPTVAIDPALMAKARAFKVSLPTLTTGIDRIYLHWSVEGMNCTSASYNAEVIYTGDQHVYVITNDPTDNTPPLVDGKYAAHTYCRNSGGFGFAISGMD